MEYKIVASPIRGDDDFFVSRGQLQDWVNEMINNGWRLQGGPFMYGNQFIAQALVKGSLVVVQTPTITKICADS